jgi:hypothetical protein
MKALNIKQAELKEVRQTSCAMGMNTALHVTAAPV